MQHAVANQEIELLIGMEHGVAEQRRAQDQRDERERTHDREP